MRLALALSLLLIAGAAGAARAADPGGVPGARASISPQAADALAVRASRAPLIVVAQPLKVWDKGLAECRVVSVLQGSFSDRAKTFRVRFGKVHDGAWPQKGVVAVYFLRPPIGGRTSVFTRKTVFELISDTEGLAAPSENVIAVIRLVAAGKYTKASDRGRVDLKLPGPHTVLGTMIDATYVSIGTIEEANLVLDPKVAVQITFRVETVFKSPVRRDGKSVLRPGRVIVNVPRVPAKVQDPGRRTLNPRVGPAVLMFSRMKRGGAFSLVSPYRGYIPIPDRSGIAARAKDLAEKALDEKELRRRGLIGNPASRASVRQTLQLWWRSWNAREAENVISCYSRKSKWRKRWESGLDGRNEISKVIQDYPADIYVVFDPRNMKARKGGRELLVSVRVDVVAKDHPPELRPAVMTFVYENGMWLILHEGN